jgi:cytochrome c oxidase accessory protein FixG
MEIPKDRLATTDEFGDRVYIYPAEAKGFWRRNRDWTQLVLVVIFLVLPWLKIGGEQALLLSIPERRFAFFGLILYAHDGPLIFFLLAISVFGLALVTAVWGRIWCGWACPQTVFIDGLFRRIEFFIEGNHLQRRQLDSGPLTFAKLFKKFAKWTTFFLASTVIAHSFMAYFLGADRLAQMSIHAPSENWVDFVMVFFITFLILFDFGWFREQFCIIMCPYGRFQSVLMDKHSLAVMYNEQRGEPRKGSEAAKAQGRTGDCVSCSRCVMVCPTGIDIRRGIQMECINCTACIDACDEIMEKVKKPKGLIRYSSIAAMEGQKNIWFNFRRLFYMLIIGLAAVGLITKLATRSPLRAEVLRVVGAPYRLLEGTEIGMVINQFKIHLQNQTSLPMAVSFEIINDTPTIPVTLIEQTKEMTIQPGELTNHFLFLKFHRDLVKGLGQRDLPLHVHFKPLTNPSANSAKDTAGPFIEKTLKLLGP